MTIKELNKRLKYLEKNNDKLLLEAVEESEDLILDANRQQLMEGKTNENKSLGRYKNRKYAAFKKRLNPRGVVDLFLTGRFQKGFFLLTNRFPILFGSRDKKTKFLTSRYSGIFGLHRKSQNEVNPTIQENYLGKVRDILGI